MDIQCLDTTLLKEVSNKPPLSPRRACHPYICMFRGYSPTSTAGFIPRYTRNVQFFTYLTTCWVCCDVSYTIFSLLQEPDVVVFITSGILRWLRLELWRNESFEKTIRRQPRGNETKRKAKNEMEGHTRTDPG
ncbi:hypothetical protein J6590_059276 [Homalodisca vitripennis]|nr:hypothetical protein J6590_059276 [Homalodisca vitripennis]